MAINNGLTLKLDNDEYNLGEKRDEDDQQKWGQ